MDNEQADNLMGQGDCCREFCSTKRRCRRCRLSAGNSNLKQSVETEHEREAMLEVGNVVSSASSRESSCASNEVQGQVIKCERCFLSDNVSLDFEVDSMGRSSEKTSRDNCREDQVADSSYKQMLCQRCQISSGAREDWSRKKRSTSSSDSSTDKLQSTSNTSRSGLNKGFNYLPQDVVEAILSRLPVMSWYRSRLVSRRWNSLISRILSCSQGRQLWARSKPTEKWLLLSNRMHGLLCFYDVRKNACYNWREFWPLIPHSKDLCFKELTSLKGVVFVSVCRALDVNMFTSMWECNPLTGGHDQLPLMPHNTVWVGDMVAFGRGDSSPGSYKLLVFSSDYEYPGRSRLQLYDSITMVWEEVAKPVVSSMWLPEVVKSFGVRNGKVTVFDKYQTHLYDPLWDLCCYSFDENEWVNHQVQGFERGDRGWHVQRWEIFERDWELILLLVYKDLEYPWSSRMAQIWRNPLPSKVDVHPLGERPWQLLSKMPDALKIIVPDEGEAKLDSSSDKTHFAEAFDVLDDPELKAFAVGDELTGDRLVIISIESNYVVTFNFSKPPHEAWTAIPFSALECPSSTRQGPTTRSQTSGRGSGPGSSNSSARVDGTIHRLLTDRSMIGCSFDPDVFGVSRNNIF